MTKGPATGGEGTGAVMAKGPTRVPKGLANGLTPAEATVDELERDRSLFLRAGRESIGVAGRYEYGPWRPALRASGTGAWPAVLLGSIAGLSASSLIGWSVLAPRMAATLGVGSFSLLPIVELIGLAVSGWLLARARNSHRRWAVSGGAACAAVALVTGALAFGSWGVWGLVPSAALGGVALGALAVSHAPLVWDLYRPEVRLRAFCIYAAALLTALAVAVMVMSLAFDRTGLTWRGCLLVLAAVSVVSTGATRWVPDPPPARWDRGRLHRLIGAAAAPDASDSVWERLRRVIAVPTIPVLLVTGAVLGLVLVPVPTFAVTMLRDRFDTTDGSLLFGLALAGNLVGVVWLHRRGEVSFRRAPAELLVGVMWMTLVAGAGLAVCGVMPDLALAVVALAVAVAGVGVVVATLPVATLAAVHPDCRPHAAWLGWAAVLCGAIIGQQLISSVAARFGAQWALVIGGAAVIGAGFALLRPMRTAEADIDAIVGELVEAAELQVAVDSGRALPLLRCRHLDFSYGQLQVLFGVDFTVEDGQMVALLGTNGAGKSTLLRAISGLGHPDRGTIHFRGADITHLAADGRVKAGITQVAGGRAVFGAMTVMDNLRAFSYTDGRAFDAALDVCFEAFPRLAERRNQLASTLSGGEQQMLGLTKAFILQPRLLLIDELSLGLAPVIVADLLTMVRRINAAGAAVVLVEQSANIALSLVDHAYFMEKGEIRFDGRAPDLLARPDLLRSVFLEGASKAVR